LVLTIPHARSLKTLLEVLQEEMTAPAEAAAQPPPLPTPQPAPLSEKARGKLPMGAPVPLSVVQNGVAPGARAPHSATRSVRFSTQPQAQAPLTDVHRRARLRLLPLLSIEAVLTRHLFPELAASVGSAGGGAEATSSPTAPGVKEVCVRAGNAWKEVLVKLQRDKSGKNGVSLTEELTTVLEACREDIVSMWEDQAVKDMLRRRMVRLQDMPGL
jgi:guanine nucleotide-binding protein alpha-1 subunit